MSDIVPIPEPAGLPIIGYAASMDRNTPLNTFKALADQYGEIYRVKLGPVSMVFCNSVALVDELCNEKRFKKIPNGALAEIRNGVHDGLFTAHIEEPNWGIAHRILMPAFGPMGIRRMFDEMHDVATQMCLKFARHGPSQPINVSDDFTRLALDTLALCTMGFRFNSYYNDKMHPFIQAMGDFLTDSGTRARRGPLPAFFYRNQDAKYFADIDILRSTANDVLQERKTAKDGAQFGRRDLLTAMLEGVDSKTGQKMTDASIIDNLVTFLIAGHETTSGTLSFALYRLLKNPECFRKAQKEVDDVVGTGPITVEHMTKLPYIEAVLREAMRLDSPITLYGVTSLEDTVLGGKYAVPKDERCLVFLGRSHVDPAVFEDPLEFRPERMLPKPFSELPKNAWKPFGNGARACIGRPFAWQEAILAMTMLLQNFNFVMDDPTYSLAIKQTLTIKPDNFFARAILRDNMTATQLEHRLAGTDPAKDKPADHDAKTNGAANASNVGQPMTILFGSNSGTCESMAHRLAADAPRHGFKVATLDCMDAYKGNLPKDGSPVVIITPSYEGAPADNAAHFVSWIENTKEKELEGVNYVVFGCGHHDWSQTFHRIPKLVDARMAEAGATRLVDMGLCDAADGDMFVDFETWEDNHLWPAFAKKYESVVDEAAGALAGLSLKVAVSTPRVSTLRENVQEAEVMSNKTLTAPGEPVKQHIEIELPTGTTYRSGDYLAVLPLNPRETVSRAMRRFELPWDAHITIDSDGLVPLPKGQSMPASSIFGAYVELGQPATKRNIAALADATVDPVDKATLTRLSDADYAAEISAKRVSVLDLLERFPNTKLPLEVFLSILPPMRVRQYSISSSPLWNPSRVTLTFALLEEPSKSGTGQKYIGVASSYLASLQPGDRLHVAVRQSHAAFHLPQDPESTPVICVAAGTGLAPFRGFMQERAAMISAGRKLAPAYLYYGCRQPGKDDLHADELAEWEGAGVVNVKRAYSRAPEKSSSGQSKYAQDALWADRENVAKVWEEGTAKLYVCGSRKVSEGVTKAALDMARERHAAKGEGEMDEGKLMEWWDGLRNVRYATDVFD